LQPDLASHIKFGGLPCRPTIVPCMAKSNDIKENFSALLRDSLRARFGRIPSAAVVAREFNLRAYDTAPVSQESARRWLRGVSLPEEERLRVLVNWLNLDFNEALKTRPRSLMARPVDHSGNGLHATAEPLSSRRQDTAEHPTPAAKPSNGAAHIGNGMAKEEADLIRMMMRLDSNQRTALLNLLKLNFSTQKPPL